MWVELRCARTNLSAVISAAAARGLGSYVLLANLQEFTLSHLINHYLCFFRVIQSPGKRWLIIFLKLSILELLLLIVAATQP